MEIQKRKLSELNPATYNPRQDLQPGDPEYEKIKRSIEEFGYVDPIIVNKDGTIIGGHQRYKILLKAGYKTAEVSVVDLDKNREKALNIALNKTGGDWDMEKLRDLIGEIDLSGLDATITGFNTDEVKKLVGKIDVSWFEREEKELDKRQEGNKEYNEFLDKFEPKKTTDDCYTPEQVYDAVAEWVAEEYGLQRKDYVRPFYPGGTTNRKHTKKTA
jgi:ParB-like chromosome segregation protein Spo0J